MNDQNLILIGYRGSGKSSLGRELADRLARPFIDTDELVRDRFDGLTIAEIWAQFGEPAFRNMECTVTAELLRYDAQVIALGGGTPVQPLARTSLENAANAFTIYLHASPEVLLARIDSDLTTRTERPALTAASDQLDEIRDVLARRDPLYRSLADLIIEVGELSVDDAVEKILRAVK